MSKRRLEIERREDELKPNRNRYGSVRLDALVNCIAAYDIVQESEESNRDSNDDEPKSVINVTTN